MMVKNLKIFLQNVQKNKLLTDMLLEINKDLNIILIQEPSWSTIYSILSFTSKEGDFLVDAPNYSNWIIFSRSPLENDNYLRVILYINVYLSYMCFSLCKDIFNYRDICCFSFFNNSNIFFIINV